MSRITDRIMGIGGASKDLQITFMQAYMQVPCEKDKLAHIECQEHSCFSEQQRQAHIIYDKPFA